MTPIQTERLVLRSARESDLEAIHAILSEPRAMRYWSTLPHTSRMQSKDWLQSMIDTAPNEGMDFIIELNGAPIGKAGCWRVPEIGFILHPDYWGKGYAVEALSAAIPAIFNAFELPAIEADVDPRNVDCLALLKKMGFIETAREEKTFKLGDEWCDSIYLALKRPN